MQGKCPVQCQSWNQNPHELSCRPSALDMAATISSGVGSLTPLLQASGSESSQVEWIERDMCPINCDNGDDDSYNLMSAVCQALF